LSCVWAIQGTYDRVFGSVSIAITVLSDPTGTPEVHCINNSFSGVVDKPGCNSAHGTTGDGVSLTWTKPCDIPDGETLRKFGQLPPDGTYTDTTFMWLQTLISSTDANADFSGRHVFETLEQVLASDTCYFPQSKYPQDALPGELGGSWWVDETNTYALDEVGYSVDAVRYYRSRGRTNPSCGQSWIQHMSIDCAENQPEYLSRAMSISMTATEVSASKGSSSQSTTWP
jgi:hypothetical protein